MDPQKTFEDFLSLISGDRRLTRDESIEADLLAFNYMDWRALGGFSATDQEGRLVIRLDDRNRGYWALDHDHSRIFIRA